MAGKLRTGYADADIVVDENSALIHGSFGYSTASISSTETKIVASDAASSDFFGISVAAGNGRIVIGSPNDDDNSALQSGSAYLFDLDGNELVKMTASDPVQNDQFGGSVAIGNDRIVVGAPGVLSGRGAAYVFDFHGNQLFKILASDGAGADRFGYSVAVGCERIVVGAYEDDDDGDGSGSAYIYDLNGTLINKITASDGSTFASFGFSVAIGNGRIVVGARTATIGSNNFQGAAYIFDLDGNEIKKINTTNGASYDYFGTSVAIGNGRIVVGQTEDAGPGKAYVYDLNGNLINEITASDVATQAGYGIGAEFGNSVAVNSGRIVVGSWRYSIDPTTNFRSGAIYVYDLDGNDEIAKITSSDASIDDRFGNSVAVGSGKIVAGAYIENPGGLADAGSAYIFDAPQTYDTYIEKILGH